jgi:hypothetical protein
VYRVRFVQSCERAGIPIESVAAALRQGRMSLAFMDQPSYRWASLTSKTFRELAEETGLRVEMLLAVEEALGTARPDPATRSGRTFWESPPSFSWCTVPDSASKSCSA